jgi:hypothetical protein
MDDQTQLASLIISIIILIIVIILIIIVCCGYNNNNNNTQPILQNPRAAVAGAYAYKNKFGQTAICHGSRTCAVPFPYSQPGPQQQGDVCGRYGNNDPSAWCQNVESKCMTAFDNSRTTIGCQN